MSLDTLTYVKIDVDTFTKEVFKESVLDDSKEITDPAFEIACLEAQISDMKAGVVINPESGPEIDILIANYNEAIAILKS